MNYAVIIAVIGLLLGLVSTVATLANYLLMLNVKLAVANLRAEILKMRSDDVAQAQRWVEDNFARLDVLNAKLEILGKTTVRRPLRGRADG